MAPNFAQPKCTQPLPRLKKGIAEMSFHTKQKVFTGSRQTAIRKCQPKPISTLFNKILHISSPWGGGAGDSPAQAQAQQPPPQYSNQSQFPLHSTQCITFHQSRAPY